MAQLNDSVVQGSLRVTDTIYTTDFNMTASKTAAYVLASPASAAGAPTFRTLTATDIPTLTKSKISDFAHTHGNISNDGKIGTATAAVYVSSGTITASSFAMASPAASGSATAFISSVTQNANGSITASKANLPVASSSVTGIIKIGTSSADAMAGNTTVTNVAISANTTTNVDYPVVFATSNTATTSAKNEGVQKSGTKFYFNPSTGKLSSTMYTINAHCTLQWNTTSEALEFVF